mmetsp:Transcript_1061/g.2219  ORF Transcript_1061/g.2219 Transcript_1061/m.2219 type:complete len:386 (+) Transcript_1061:598-1755(+)
MPTSLSPGGCSGCASASALTGSAAFVAASTRGEALRRPRAAFAPPRPPLGPLIAPSDGHSSMSKGTGGNAFSFASSTGTPSLGSAALGRAPPCSDGSSHFSFFAGSIAGRSTSAASCGSNISSCSVGAKQSNSVSPGASSRTTGNESPGGGGRNASVRGRGPSVTDASNCASSSAACPSSGYSSSRTSHAAESPVAPAASSSGSQWNVSCGSCGHQASPGTKGVAMLFMAAASIMLLLLPAHGAAGSTHQVQEASPAPAADAACAVAHDGQASTRGPEGAAAGTAASASATSSSSVILGMAWGSGERPLRGRLAGGAPPRDPRRPCRGAKPRGADGFTALRTVVYRRQFTGQYIDGENDTMSFPSASKAPSVCLVHSKRGQLCSA